MNGYRINLWVILLICDIDHDVAVSPDLLEQ